MTPEFGTRICTVGVEIRSVEGEVLGKAAISKCVPLVFAGGDTMAPSGLYARLCHAFSSFIVFYSEQSYRSIRY